MSNIYRTTNLNLAVFLHAQRTLPYAGVKHINKFKMEFCFEDPQRRGDELEMQYESGAQLPVNAVLASLKFLRKDMNNTANETEYRGSSNGQQNFTSR